MVRELLAVPIQTHFEGWGGGRCARGRDYDASVGFGRLRVAEGDVVVGLHRALEHVADAVGPLREDVGIRARAGDHSGLRKKEASERHFHLLGLLDELGRLVQTGVGVVPPGHDAGNVDSSGIARVEQKR